MTTWTTSSVLRFGIWQVTQSVGGGMHALGDQPIESSGVALAANFGIMADGFFSAQDPMRIMAGIAGQGVLALEKTAGFPKPVRGAADDLKLVVVLRSGRMIESQFESAQRLAGGEGKRPAIEPPDQRGNRRAGRLQVTLHAEIHPQLRTQPGGIHDAGANLLAHVTAAWAMTPLAVNAFGKVAAKDRLATRSIVAGWNARDIHRGKKRIHRKPAGGWQDAANRTPDSSPNSRPFPNTSRAAARSVFRAPCDGDRSGRGCQNQARSRSGTPRRWFRFRRNRFASAAGSKRRRAESSRNACPTKDGKTRCSLCSLRRCWRAWDETEIVPFRFEDGSERSGYGNPRKFARRHSCSTVWAATCRRGAEGRTRDQITIARRDRAHQRSIHWAGRGPAPRCD